MGAEPFINSLIAVDLCRFDVAKKFVEMAQEGLALIAVYESDDSDIASTVPDSETTVADFVPTLEGTQLIRGRGDAASDDLSLTRGHAASASASCSCSV